MGKKQNETGHKAELIVYEFFHEKKYWTFLIPKSIGGQPFDIIARKDNNDLIDIWFIDAKHLEADKVSFPFDRIEPNQETSMGYSNVICGINKNMGFAIVWDRTQEIYFFSYREYLEMKNNNQKSVKIENLEVLKNLCVF